MLHLCGGWLVTVDLCKQFLSLVELRGRRLLTSIGAFRHTHICREVHYGYLFLFTTAGGAPPRLKEPLLPLHLLLLARLLERDLRLGSVAIHKLHLHEFAGDPTLGRVVHHLKLNKQWQTTRTNACVTPCSRSATSRVTPRPTANQRNQIVLESFR